MDWTQSAWYALRVKPKQERIAGLSLDHKGLEPFVPLYQVRRKWSDRWKELTVPLFAGYVFCRFSSADRVTVLSTPGVLSIVGCGKAPAAISDTEIQSLQTIARAGAEVRPCPFLEAGNRVSITTGPLAGLTGIILRVRDRNRLVVSVSLLRRSVAVEIDTRWVIPGASAASQCA